MPSLSVPELLDRARELKRKISPCELCPRRCGSLRLEGETGFCGIGDRAVVSSAIVHHGEEPPISGLRGSGTVFLSGCNASCIFCQNYQISHLRMGRNTDSAELARQFLYLQDCGCHNINWVTPTPHLPFLVEALAIAVDEGLRLPIVYNTNGYDRLEILQLLDGIVDIYLPDMKYSADVWAEEFSQLPDYFAINSTAVREMHRQVGPLQLDDDGIAVRGLLVRHLVLPGGTAGSRKIFERLAAIDPQIPVSIMAQYHPCYKALRHSMIGRRITKAEYQRVLDDFESAGLANAFVQDVGHLEEKDGFFPDFGKPAEDVFDGGE